MFLAFFRHTRWVSRHRCLNIHSYNTNRQIEREKDARRTNERKRKTTKVCLACCFLRSRKSNTAEELILFLRIRFSAQEKFLPLIMSCPALSLSRWLPKTTSEKTSDRPAREVLSRSRPKQPEIRNQRRLALLDIRQCRFSLMERRKRINTVVESLLWTPNYSSRSRWPKVQVTWSDELYFFFSWL